MPIAYCSTEHMLAYLFMKDIQGALFEETNDAIMGCKHVDTLHMGPPSIKERVGNSVKVGSKKKEYNPAWRQRENIQNPTLR